MPFVWLGVVLIVLKGLEVGPLAEWSWWWVLAPLAVAILWFEVIQPLLGLDHKKKIEDEYAKMRKERVAANFAGPGGKRGKPARAK